MNAYELADQVEMWGEDLLALNMKGGIPVIEGAKMIRQQQAEIEGLKMGFAGNGTSDSELAEVRAQANRWFLKIKEQQDRIGVLEANYKLQLNILKKQRDYIDQLEQGLESSIALNKAQAERQVKELTDEEIMQLYEEFIETQYASESNVLGFGRAILRKAQEK
jgi:hypothetical protein